MFQHFPPPPLKKKKVIEQTFVFIRSLQFTLMETNPNETIFQYTLRNLLFNYCYKLKIKSNWHSWQIKEMNFLKPSFPPQSSNFSIFKKKSVSFLFFFSLKLEMNENIVCFWIYWKAFLNPSQTRKIQHCLYFLEIYWTIF